MKLFFRWLWVRILLFLWCWKLWHFSLRLLCMPYCRYQDKSTNHHIKLELPNQTYVFNTRIIYLIQVNRLESLQICPHKSYIPSDCSKDQKIYIFTAIMVNIKKLAISIPLFIEMAVMGSAKRQGMKLRKVIVFWSWMYFFWLSMFKE